MSVRRSPGVEIRIEPVSADDGDEVRGSVRPGRVDGEICVRGKMLMDGYWHSPEETARTLRGGWLHTGDIGHLDDDGYLYVVDRIKDLIIRGGFNIYPATSRTCCSATGTSSPQRWSAARTPPTARRWWRSSS